MNKLMSFKLFAMKIPTPTLGQLHFRPGPIWLWAGILLLAGCTAGGQQNGLSPLKIENHNFDSSRSESGIQAFLAEADVGQTHQIQDPTTGRKGTIEIRQMYLSAGGRDCKRFVWRDGVKNVSHLDDKEVTV